MASETRRSRLRYGGAPPPWRGCQRPGGPGRHGNGCWCFPLGPLTPDRDRWARFVAEIDVRIAAARLSRPTQERRVA
jgi:hypothetical protein